MTVPIAAAATITATSFLRRLHDNTGSSNYNTDDTTTSNGDEQDDAEQLTSDDRLVFLIVNCFLLFVLLSVCTWLCCCNGIARLNNLEGNRRASDLAYQQAMQERRQRRETRRQMTPEQRRSKLLQSFQRNQVSMVVEETDLVPEDPLLLGAQEQVVTQQQASDEQQAPVLIDVELAGRLEPMVEEEQPEEVFPLPQEPSQSNQQQDEEQVTVVELVDERKQQQPEEQVAGFSDNVKRDEPTPQPEHDELAASDVVDVEKGEQQQPEEQATGIGDVKRDEPTPQLEHDGGLAATRVVDVEMGEPKLQSDEHAARGGDNIKIDEQTQQQQQPEPQAASGLDGHVKNDEHEEQPAFDVEMGGQPTAEEPDQVVVCVEIGQQLQSAPPPLVNNAPENDFMQQIMDESFSVDNQPGFLILRHPNLECQQTTTSSDLQNSNNNKILRVPNCCAICLGSYEVGETVVWSNNFNVCCHAFHQDCLLDWLVHSTQDGTPCPCCRQSFTDLKTFRRERRIRWEAGHAFNHRAVSL